MSYALTRKSSSAPAAVKTASTSMRGDLRIGEPDDAFEREADRVADEMTAGGPLKRHYSLATIGISAPLQRKCSCGGSGEQCEECRKKEQQTLQRKASGTAAPEFAPPIVREVLNSPGVPLDRATREFFERKFGYDFCKVRVHTDSQASESARAVGALAYTVGNHLVFRGGKYQSAIRDDRSILAHELAHVVQQNDGLPVRSPAATLAGGPSGKEHLSSRRLIAPTVQRTEDAYANLTIDELRKRAPSDPGAAEALRERFHNMSNTELERYARSDPAAQAEYAQRTVIPKAAEGQGPFSNPTVRDALQKDIEQQRAASGITRREPSAVTPDVETQGGTIGSARTDIPGLENRAFIGRSPQAGGEVNPQSQFAPPTDPEVLPQTHGHAEQDIADQLEKALSEIPKEQLKGRRVWMLIEQEPCSTCAQGASDPSISAGVLRKLSERFPEVTFEVKNLNSNSLIVLKGGARTAAAAASAEAAIQGKPGTTAVRVGAEIEVTNSVKQPDGTTVSDVEYKFGENFKAVNEGAPAGSEIPSRITVRVTQNAEGAITSVESLSGQPPALAEALARRTLTPGLVSEAGAAASAGRAALLFKGLRIGGSIAFAVITGYQLYKATPAQRPKVATQAAAGLAGSAAATYLVCNLLLDIETAGWGLLICGFVAGGAGGMAASEAAGAVYDEATATELDRALHQLDGKSQNERALFNIISGKLGSSATCINADFVNGFLAAIPRGLQDYETVLIASHIAKSPFAVPPPASKPPSSSVSPGMPPSSAQKEGDCPGTACHGRSQAYLQRGVPNLDKKTIEAIMAAPSCSAILSEALRMVRTAVAQLPRNQRVPGDISHHPAPGEPSPPPRTKPDPNAFPTVEEQQGKIPCPTCHSGQGDKPAFDLSKEMHKELSPEEKDLLRQWVESQKQ